MRKTPLLVVLLLVLCNFHVLAQDPLEEENHKFTISEINQREENTNYIISSISKQIKDNKFSQERNYEAFADSLDIFLADAFSEENISEATLQGLRNMQSSVEVVEKELKVIENKHIKASNSLQNYENQIEKELEYWQGVINYLNKNEEIAPSLTDRTSKIIENLKTENDQIVSHLNKELEVLGFISDYQIKLNVIKDILHERKNSIHEGIFVKDSPPIWETKAIKQDSGSIFRDTKVFFNDSIDSVKIYLDFQGGRILLHFIIILLIYLFLFFTQGYIKDSISQKHIELKPCVEHPLSSAYIYSIFIVSFFKSEYPVILFELYLIFVFYPVYQLIIRQVLPKNKIWLICFSILYTVQMVFNHITFSSYYERLFLLFFELLVFIYYLYIYQIQKYQRPQIAQLFILSAIVFAIAIVTNIQGTVKLSSLLTIATINTTGISILIYIYYKISWVIILILSERKPFSELNIIKDKKEESITRLMKLIKLLLIYLFFKTVLKQYKLEDLWIETWHGIITKSWIVGNVIITLGDFLNFFIVIVITIVLARLIKYMLKDEVLPRFIKFRGIPNAIASTVFYLIILLGFLIAAFSTGIEWSKINLALGAIGVGVGFGLQNLVYNFIAGLVLTYERPVQVGDVIEIHTLRGEIKEIGVRSSRLQTYDGAEVVVPNGNLISNEVINWTLSNNHKRQELRFIVSSNADPKEVIEILRNAVMDCPNAIIEPSPLPLFEGFTDEGTLNFKLLFWTHVNSGLSTKSAIAFAVYDEFKARGYEFPIQQSTIRIKTN